MRTTTKAATLGAVLTASLLSASPAMAAPPVPAGCSFDGGTLTCVTTTTTTALEGPFSTDGTVPITTVTDGFTGGQICAVAYGKPLPGAVTYVVVNVDLQVETRSTTTTVQRGVSGKSPILSSTSVTSRTLLDVVGFTAASKLVCNVPPS